MSSVAVVGSGQCGLLCAERLAREGIEVILIERLPQLGGQEPERDIGRLIDSALRAGVRGDLGTMAVSYGDDLQTLGVDGAATRPVDALVVATGTRPATRGELGIAGDRCAGVLPGPVALHVTRSGVLPGRWPVILGGGQLASECADLLRRAGAARVTVIAPDGLIGGFTKGVETHSGQMISSIRGSDRVSSVTLDPSGRTLPCDAVILAHERRPAVNIEGATSERPGVVFCISTSDPRAEADARRAAESATAEVIELLRQNVSVASSPTS